MSHVPRPYNEVTTDIVDNSLRANQLTTRWEKNKEDFKNRFKSNHISYYKYFLKVPSLLTSQQGYKYGFTLYFNSTPWSYAITTSSKTETHRSKSSKYLGKSTYLQNTFVKILPSWCRYTSNGLLWKK